MCNGLLPPQILTTPGRMCGVALRTIVDMISTRTMRRSEGFNRGDNPDDGMLCATRWRLPDLWQSVARTEYDIGIVRCERGMDKAVYDRIATQIKPFYAHGQSVWFDTICSFHDSRSRPNYGDFCSSSCFRSNELPGTHGTSTFSLVLSLTSPHIKTLSAASCTEYLQQRLDQTSLGIKLDRIGFPEWGGPVPCGTSGLAVRIGREQNHLGERALREIEVSGFESMEHARTLAQRAVMGLEIHSQRQEFSWNGPPEYYDHIRECLNSLCPGWGFEYLGQRRHDINPYDDDIKFGTDTARWIPMVEWNRKVAPGTGIDSFVCSILRCDDGLRLEFCSSCRDNEILRKEILRVAGPIEVIPVEPGSEFDLE